MSLDLKRWALMAYEMQFQQLDAARKQAESWRTGLTALTALLGTVLIVKGRDSFAELTPPFRWLIALLLGAALAMLVWATMLVVRAVAGPPGEKIILSGEALKAWTAAEVAHIATAIRAATRLTLGGVCAIALAVGLTWLGPAEKPTSSLVQVEHDRGRLCGELIGADQRQLVIKNSRSKRTELVPLTTVVTMTSTSRCGTK
ncbi:hypothetical protein [Actinomadura sp. 3N508]|uniref:hypothetical protein n=1 Tax=Actinomadura sp. 3N508 TaxID=3375153 RepID=UPI0037BD751D